MSRYTSRSGLISRRGILQSTALATLLAPVLRARDAHGATTSPRRIILIYSPNGPMQAAGPASGLETAFQFHDWWKALDRHRADGIFLSHMATTGAGVVEGNGHALGGQVFSGSGWTGFQNGSHGETIDQVIGKRLESQGQAGIRRSVVWGLGQGAVGEGFQATGGRDISPQTDPSKAWADIFGSFMAPAPGASPNDAAVKRAAALLARDQSILDFVYQDCMALKGALGSEGTRLLDDHCTTVRSLEQNLMSGMTSTPSQACIKPGDPGPLAWTDPENVDRQSAAFIDLMGTALACELTHVIAFQFAGLAARNRLAAKYGVPSAPTQNSGDSGPAHHPWTHMPSSSSAMMNTMRIFTTFYSTQVALLVDKLKSTIDANGKPLLDSTIVVWASELGGNEANGDAHQTGSLPVVWIGSGQGVFKTGRYIHGKSPDTGSSGVAWQAAGADTGHLLVSAVQYMGLTDVDTVGATGVKGPLTSLYV